MKHFSELSQEEVEGMIEVCKSAAVEYADKIGMSGLSEEGSHNIYTAIEDAIFSEYGKSRRLRKK